MQMAKIEANVRQNLKKGKVTNRSGRIKGACQTLFEAQKKELKCKKVRKWFVNFLPPLKIGKKLKKNRPGPN